MGKQQIIRAACVSASMLLGLALTARAEAPSLECRGAEKPQEVAELLFGRRIGMQGYVAEGVWRRFVAREVTPRFPEGVTILEARGQWRNPGSRRIVREPSKVVMIAMPGHAQDHQRLNEIAEAYKKQFRQHSVGIIIRQACVSF